MQKHPYKIHVQYLLCQWDHAFYLTCCKTVWISDDGETNLFLGEFCPHLQKRAPIFGWKEGTPFNEKKKENVLCVHWLVSSAQAVTTVGHSMFLFPHFGTFLTVCPVCEFSSSQCSWLNCLFDLTSSELSLSAGRGGFCDHLTSLINKSSVAK